MFMCHQASLTADKRRLEIRNNSRLNIIGRYEPRYLISGFKRQNMFMISMENPHEIVPAIWSLVPQIELQDMELFERNYTDIAGFWRKFDTVDIHKNQLLTNRFYRPSAVSGRCLILADGFFKKNWTSSTSEYFYLKGNEAQRELFCFAGIYSKLDTDSYTCAVITTEPWVKRDSIHATMPLVLEREFEKEWLRQDLTKSGFLSLLKSGSTTANFISHQVADFAYNGGYQTTNPRTIQKIN